MKEYSELKKRAMLAKQRLKMGYWNRLEKEREEFLRREGNSAENQRKIKEIQRARFIRENVECINKADISERERMYIKVCQIIGVSFGKNKLKAISSAVLTNLITQLAGIFAMQVAASFIPGAGLVIVGVGNFTVTYFAGLIFLNVLTKIFQAKRTDIEEMSNEEWVNSIKMAFSSIDKKAVLNEAKNLFMQMRKDGSLDEAGKNIDISTEEDN